MFIPYGLSERRRWNCTISPMPTSEEKAAFSERLKFALRRSPEKVAGATELANKFNLRHRGTHPVSPQTAHKWLTGRTIPTSDKLETLAEWLRVELHWLHYGPSPSVIEHPTPQPLPRDARYPPTPETIELASKIEALSPHLATSFRNWSSSSTAIRKSKRRNPDGERHAHRKTARRRPEAKKPHGRTMRLFYVHRGRLAARGATGVRPVSS
nr:hypothetical protein [Burkholderia sp. MS455]